MKVAKVIPLFKTGDMHDFSNYRPVSSLSQFSKVLEKVFAQKLDNFIELLEGQYGFRANRSTALALIEIMEEITTAVDNNNYTTACLLIYKSISYY